MSGETAESERLEFCPRPELPGLVEGFTAHQTPRTWTVFNVNFAVARLIDWRGRVDYRRRTVPAGPRSLFYSEPGEVHRASPEAGDAGSFSVILIGPEMMQEHWLVEGGRGTPHWSQIVSSPTPAVAQTVKAMYSALARGAPPLELQSRLAAFFHHAASELLERTPRPPPREASLQALASLREQLHDGDGDRVNLLQFARSAGMSQFQLLRGFKRLYGLPPHAYELLVRVERARAMIRDGFSVAHAAAANNFVDQSHLTRHFRKSGASRRANTGRKVPPPVPPNHPPASGAGVAPAGRVANLRGLRIATTEGAFLYVLAGASSESHGISNTAGLLTFSETDQRLK